MTLTGAVNTWACLNTAVVLDNMREMEDCSLATNLEFSMITASGFSVLNGPLVSGVELTSGQKVKAVVLHVDPTTPLVHISLLPALLGNRKTVSS